MIQAHLKAIHPRVYFQVAPESAQYSYIVYDFSNSLDDGEGLQVITLDVDGWDNPGNGDTTALETLMDTINESLNKKSLTTDTLTVSFYAETKLPLTDDDPRIRRRKYIYQARLFERS